jgi:hypothetical protein
MQANVGFSVTALQCTSCGISKNRLPTFKKIETPLIMTAFMLNFCSGNFLRNNKFYDNVALLHICLLYNPEQQ